MSERPRGVFFIYIFLLQCFGYWKKNIKNSSDCSITDEKKKTNRVLLQLRTEDQSRVAALRKKIRFQNRCINDMFQFKYMKSVLYIVYFCYFFLHFIFFHFVSFIFSDFFIRFAYNVDRKKSESEHMYVGYRDKGRRKNKTENVINSKGECIGKRMNVIMSLTYPYYEASYNNANNLRTVRNENFVCVMNRI